MSNILASHSIRLASVLISVAIGLQVGNGPPVRGATQDEEWAEQAPIGTLRACVNTTLVVLAGVDAAGELQGPFVDLTRALAEHWGVGFEARGYRTDAQRLEMVAAGECDVVTHSLPAAAAAEAVLDAASPLVAIDLTYLLPPDSPIQSTADVDQPGVRVAVTRATTTDRVASNQLSHAQLVRIEGDAGVALTSGEADVLASLRPDLIVRASRWPSARVLDDGFSVVYFGLAVAKDTPTRLRLVNEFSEDARASGLVQDALDRHAVQGVQVAGVGE